MLCKSSVLLVSLMFVFVPSAGAVAADGKLPTKADATGAYRPFTDSRGREIQARVLRISGEQVTIQRRDGKRFTVPIGAFSQADQDFLRQPAKPKSGSGPKQTTAPEQAGLAAKYPHDQGVDRDPRVVFAEDFEGDALRDVGWEQPGGFYDLKGHPVVMRITDQEAAVGRHSLELVHPAGEVSPQWLHRKFPGQDTVFVRFYRKFQKDWVWAPLGIHDTILFAGKYNSPAAADQALYLDISGIEQRWSDKNALAETVLSKQPVLVLKSSFQGPGLDFGIRREIISHVGWDNYYVLPDNVNRAPVLQGGRWYCFEMMGKMNTGPGRKDGELRLWVDDQLVTEMKGLVLRNDTHATIQWDHWLLGPRYGDSQEYGQGPPRELKSWIDGLVVATSRIGPVAKARP